MFCQNNTKRIKVLVPKVTLVPVVTFVEQEQELVLRPWKQGEVPIGAMFKSYGDRIQRIEGFDPQHACIKSPAILLSGGKYSYDNHYFTSDLITSICEPKYSWDGVNWYRCGTWVPVE